MNSQAEEDVLDAFNMDGARRRQSDPFSSHSRMGLGDADDGLDDDLHGLREESEGDIPPLVSLQGRGNSQPLTMNHAQAITVSASQCGCPATDFFFFSFLYFLCVCS